MDGAIPGHMEVRVIDPPRISMLSSILQKPIGAITILGTAIGGPYALFETDAGTATRVALSGWMNGAPAEGSTAVPAGGMVPAEGVPLTHRMLAPQNPADPASTGIASNSFVAGPSQPAPSWTPPPIADLREVIRFDMNPLALPHRFPQVTTFSSPSALDGYRVALVTGTNPTDLAGTLTYWFDARRAVQRIQFVGSTGDPSMVAGMMVQYYGLRPEASVGGQLFTSRWNNRITSLLHVRTAPVMNAEAPNANYQIFLELNQPSTYYSLSDEAYGAAGLAPPPPSSSFFGF